MNTAPITKAKTAAEKNAAPPPADALDALLTAHRPMLAALHQAMQDSLSDGGNEMVSQVAAHVLRASGKQLRGAVTLLSCRLCNAPAADAMQAAVAVEFIHTAALLHDDVVDEAAMRRRQPSANAAFGNAAAVLVGDFFYSRASQMLAKIDSFPLHRLVADSTNQLAAGEVLQLANRGAPSLDEKTYFEIIEKKTANLFDFAAACGALLLPNDNNEKRLPALRAYGRNLGLAFQLVDDCLDYEGSDARLGKEPGRDFAEGKITLPIILALNSGGEKTKSAWQDILRQGGGDGFARARALVCESGALDAARARAEKFAAAAAAALEEIDSSADEDAARALAALAAAAAKRQR